MKVKELFEEYLVYYEKIGQSKKTIKNDCAFLFGSLSHSIHEMDIDSLQKTDVAKVIEAGRRHGRYGAQRSVLVLRKFLRFAKGMGHPAPFNWREIAVPRVPQKENEYLREAELETLLDAIDITAPAGLRTRALLEVLYASGLRVGEAILLNREDIDWDNKSAIVVNIKSKERQMVNFTDRSLSWLKRYLESRKDDNPALFISGRARMVRGSSIWYLRTHIQPLAEKLGIRKTIKHYIFRKTFVTHLIQRGADIIVVRVLARHRSERTTLQSYAAIDRERSKGIHAAIMNDLLGDS